MICIQDSYGRYLKSSVFKDTQKKAVVPEPHRFRLALKLKALKIIFLKLEQCLYKLTRANVITHNILSFLSDSQLEQNAKKRRPSLSPIILRQQEEAQKAKLAASGPVDITQVMSKLAQKKWGNGLNIATGCWNKLNEHIISFSIYYFRHFLKIF